jgi:hypothetical protein
MNLRAPAVALLTILAAACGDDSSATTSSSGTGGGSSGEGGGAPSSSPSSVDASSSSSAEASGSGAGSGAGGAGSGTGGQGGGGSGQGGAPARCPDPAPADRERFVVVGHPFPNGATDWEVLSLSEAGELSRIGQTFEMGSAVDAPIAFSPDGSMGFAVQDDGSLGVFRLAVDGTPTVVDAAFGLGDMYAGGVHVAPSGDHLLVNDVNWPKNGGGIYRIDFDCTTGDLGAPERVAESKNGWQMLSLGADRWALAGTGALGVEDQTDVHDLREADPWTRAGGVSAFTLQGATPGGFSRSRDGGFLLVGDIGFDAQGLSLLSVTPSAFTFEGNIPLEDPYSIAIAPEGDVAIVVSGFGDAIFVVEPSPDGDTPLSLRGELAYVDGAPQVPGIAAMVERGSLDGLVLVEDVEGLRLTSVGDGVPGLVAGLGIQP